MIMFVQGGKDAAAQLKFAMDSSAEDIGKGMGQKLTDALFGPEVWVDADRKMQGHFARQGGGLGNWKQIGGDIGDAIGTGITVAVGRDVMTYLDHVYSAVKVGVLAPSPILQDLDNLSRAFGFSYYDKGGMVPGWVGQPQLAVVHGGERVQTPAQQVAGNGDVVAALEQQTQVLGAILAALGSGGSSTGVEAALYNAIESSKDWRRRGVIGATR